MARGLLDLPSELLVAILEQCTAFNAPSCKASENCSGKSLFVALSCCCQRLRDACIPYIYRDFAFSNDPRWFAHQARATLTQPEHARATRHLMLLSLANMLPPRRYKRDFDLARRPAGGVLWSSAEDIAELVSPLLQRLDLDPMDTEAYVSAMVMLGDDCAVVAAIVALSMPNLESLQLGRGSPFDLFEAAVYQQMLEAAVRKGTWGARITMLTLLGKSGVFLVLKMCLLTAFSDVSRPVLSCSDPAPVRLLYILPNLKSVVWNQRHRSDFFQTQHLRRAFLNKAAASINISSLTMSYSTSHLQSLFAPFLPHVLRACSNLREFRYTVCYRPEVYNQVENFHTTPLSSAMAWQSASLRKVRIYLEFDTKHYIPYAVQASHPGPRSPLARPGFSYPTVEDNVDDNSDVEITEEDVHDSDRASHRTLTALEEELLGAHSQPSVSLSFSNMSALEHLTVPAPLLFGKKVMRAWLEFMCPEIRKRTEECPPEAFYDRFNGTLAAILPRSLRTLTFTGSNGPCASTCVGRAMLGFVYARTSVTPVLERVAVSGAPGPLRSKAWLDGEVHGDGDGNDNSDDDSGNETDQGHWSARDG